MPEYDALLLVSFGGPEGHDDVLPFLRRVTAGRGVPDERLAVVAEHYHHFGGVSPINGQNRELLSALDAELRRRGHRLPVYWGNRNWHPLLADEVARMRDDGVGRALALVTSAFGSFSGCRQYLGDIDRARAEVGPGAPVIDKLGLFWDRPGFLDTVADATAAALARIEPTGRGPVALVFSAHSIPRSMAAVSPYESQLRAAARSVAARVGEALPWELVWQSRSGPPSVPWLEPDIGDHLRALAQAGTTSVVVVPIGFVSDHVEVLWDLDTEAAAIAEEVGIDLVRAATVGTSPRFVASLADMVEEAVVGDGPVPCVAGCCVVEDR